MSLYPLRRLVVPVLLLMVALYLRTQLYELAIVYLELLVWLPYVTLVTALTLSVYYNRSREFTITLILMLVYCLIQTQLQVPLSDARALSVYSLASLILPVCLLLLLITPERGLCNRYGISLTLVILLLWLAGWWLITQVSEATAIGAINTWMPVRQVSGVVSSIMANVVYIVFMLAGLVLLFCHDDEYTAVLLGVSLFSFVTFAFFDLVHISMVMFTSLGVILLLSLLGSSYDMAYRDDLTGLLGRRALNDRLQGLGSRYVIAMLDVDHFKKFNDTYGHDVGDEVLKMVAKHISMVAGGGLPYRYGGEEFCVVFPGKNPAYCTPFLEAVRNSVEHYRMELRDSKNRAISQSDAELRRGRRAGKRARKSVSVTISIGMAERNQEHNSPDDVLKAADSALYQAKKNGRNCLVY